FNANCRILGSMELRSTPKTLLEKVVSTPPVGQAVPKPCAQPGRKLFVTLYASARNSILWLSRKRNTRDRAISKDQVAGPRTLLRPIFPVLPVAGCAKAAGLR